MSEIAISSQRRDRYRRSDWYGEYAIVGEEGLEPSRVLPHRNLNPARLPIPPLARGGKDGITTQIIVIESAVGGGR